MEPQKTVLPADFDGLFYFTNPTEEEFTAKWNGKPYTYPALSRSPMIIMDATPVEIQNIRKKFARELAEREFYRSDKYKSLSSIEKNGNGPALNSFKQANSYSDTDLAPFIQKCLEPLELKRATVGEKETFNVEANLRRDDEGNVVTDVVDRKTSLRKRALEAA